MRQFIRVFVALYLSNSLSQHLNIDMILCMYCMQKKRKEKSTGAPDFHGGQPLPEDLNVNPLISICVAINFIYIWVNIL